MPVLHSFHRAKTCCSLVKRSWLQYCFYECFLQCPSSTTILCLLLCSCTTSMVTSNKDCGWLKAFSFNGMSAGLPNFYFTGLGASASSVVVMWVIVTNLQTCYRGSNSLIHMALCCNDRTFGVAVMSWTLVLGASISITSTFCSWEGSSGFAGWAHGFFADGENNHGYDLPIELGPLVSGLNWFCCIFCSRWT